MARETESVHSCPAGTALRLGTHGQLHILHSGLNQGILAPRDLELLQLFDREGIEYDLLWMPEQGWESDRAERQAAVWATLYGPREIAQDLQDTFQNLDLYLQDPIHAQRDTVYFNPQRLFNEPESRTTDFKLSVATYGKVGTVHDEEVLATDLLENIRTGSSLHETPGSPCLITELKR